MGPAYLSILDVDTQSYKPPAHWTCMIVVKKRTHAKRAREHLTQDAVPIPMSQATHDDEQN